MRDLSSDFAASLSAQATHLCHCWRLARRDGAVFGFTDHDEDLTFGGQTYLARGGLDAREAEQSLGFAIGGGEVEGALTGEALSEADLAAGKFDGATVEIWLVDWRAPARRVLMNVASVGEVSRTEFAFSAELRSLAHVFDQAQGRQIQRACSATLGDARCRVDLSAAQWRAGAVVAAVESGGALRLSLSREVEPGFFSLGTALLDGGRAPVAVARHDMPAPGVHRIFLWGSDAPALAVGEAFVLLAGCDKSPEFCRARFGNIVNFQGFPHVPGASAIFGTVARAQTPLDGSSLFK